MSLRVPYHGATQYSRNWTDARPAVTPTLVTADSTSHTLGTKAELFTATLHDTYWIVITMLATGAAATQTDMLVNIYVGASGAEKVIIPNLLAGWSAAQTSVTGNAPSKIYEFPLFIPAGSRISADAQALITSDNVRVGVELHGGGVIPSWVGTQVEVVGINTAASQGTSVTPGAAAEGTLTDIGTTVNQWKYILPMIQGAIADTNNQAQTISCDIGVGGAVYRNLDDWWFASSGNELWGPIRSYRGRNVVVPAGTLLQMRGQVSGATAEAFDAAIYGVF